MKRILLLVLTLVLAITPTFAQTLSESETTEIIDKIINAHKEIKSFYIKYTFISCSNRGDNSNSGLEDNMIEEVAVACEAYYKYPYLREESNYLRQAYSFLPGIYPFQIRLLDQEHEKALFWNDGSKMWEETSILETSFSDAFDFTNTPLHLGDFFPKIMLLKEDYEHHHLLFRDIKEKNCEQISIERIPNEVNHYLLKARFTLKWNETVEKIDLEFIIDPHTFLVKKSIYESTYKDEDGQGHMSRQIFIFDEIIPNPDIPDRIFEEIINH